MDALVDLVTIKHLLNVKHTDIHQKYGILCHCRSFVSAQQHRNWMGLDLHFGRIVDIHDYHLELIRFSSINQEITVGHKVFFFFNAFSCGQLSLSIGSTQNKM